MRRVFIFLIGVKEKTVYAIKGFKKNPVDSLGVLLPVMIGLLGLIGLIISYAMFLTHGGYITQIDSIEAYGLSSTKFDEQYGSEYYFNIKIIFILTGLLLIIQFLVMQMDYFRKSSKWWKRLMIIDLVVAGLGIGVVLLLKGFGNVTTLLSKEQQDKIIEITSGKQVQIYATIMKASFIIVAIMSVICLLLLLKSNSKWMVGYSVCALLMVYLIFPILLNVLESIILLVSMGVIIALIGIICWFIFRSLRPDGMPENEWIHIALEKGAKLYKVEHGTHSYIEFDDGINKRALCSLDDFRRGFVHIFDNVSRREIKEIEIPWR